MTTDELRAILAARTPGQWWEQGDGMVVGPSITHPGLDTVVVVGYEPDEQGRNDARAIVTAVNLIDPALGCVSALRFHNRTPTGLVRECLDGCVACTALAAFDAAMEAEK